MALALTTSAACAPGSWQADRVATTKACLVDVYDTILASAFPRTLAACGHDPAPALVARLVACDAELIISHTTVFADTAPFLAKARAAGLGIALVSNCAENTRA